MPNVQSLCATCNRYYDSSLSECPYCNRSTEIGNGNEKVCPNCGRSYDSSSVGCPYCEENLQTESKYEETTCPDCKRKHDASLSKCPYCGHTYNDEGKTEVDDKKMAFVVGWLICIAGADKGRDFRLHVDNNSVGRGVENDINLKDTKVSRQRHFSVVYDSENDNYFVMMGGGTGIVRVNNSPLGGNTPLTKGDKIRVGDTTLVFIPLETAYVQWDWQQ